MLGFGKHAVTVAMPCGADLVRTRRIDCLLDGNTSDNL